jgi:hypothetical protein
MTKQTAVDWLFLMLNNPNSDQEFANKLLKQAKKMEKEQIIDAYNEGYRDGERQEYDNKNDVSQYNDAINYYNETFKK